MLQTPPMPSLENREDLLRPGETCWRIEYARRMTLLVDNQAFFSAAKGALHQARRSIMLLGWMFDPRTRLEPGVPEPLQPDEIGGLLNALARERPELDIRLLIWDASLPVSASRHFFPQRARFWLDERIHLHLDDAHPPGACQHQKLLVIDDAVAFCSGGDFAPDRWDTPAHADHDQRRRLPSGRGHSPRHNLTMMVDGPAARMLADLARDRWRRATGETLTRPESNPGADRWPSHVHPHLTAIPVAAARTSPSWGGHSEIREVEALYLEAIAAARHVIYMENQYFASPLIGDALEARLAESDGPEVVVVCSPHSPSYFDRAVMDAARDALVARLNAFDRYDRFRAYAPHSPGGRGVIVHSKLMVVDDRFIRVGSSNLNNRSMGLDSECDLAIDAGRDERRRRAILDIRNGLVAHLLGRGRRRFERSLAMHHGLIAAIEALDRGARRRLRPLEPRSAGPFGAVTAWRHLGDPTGTRDAWRPWRRRAGPAHPPWIAVATLGGLAVAALALAWARADRSGRASARSQHGH